MPAQVTHYLQAIDVCNDLDIDRKYRNAVALGAMGPDFLYYYKLMTGGRDIRNLGTDLHSLHADELFSAFAEYIKANPNDIYARYFTYGFLCHYAFDRIAHPYVYFVQDTIVEQEKYRHRPFYIHVRIEHSLDIIMLRDKRNMYVGKFGLKRVAPTDDKLALDSAVRVMTFVINKLISDKFTERQCKKAYLDSRRFLGLANDKTGIKRLGARILETACFMSHTVSYFIHPYMEDGEWDYSNYEKANWTNKNDNTVHDDSFFELYEEATAESRRLIGLLDNYLDANHTQIDFTGNFDMKGAK